MKYRIVATTKALGRMKILSNLLDRGTPTKLLIQQACNFVLTHWDPKAAPLSKDNIGIICVTSRLMLSIDASWIDIPTLSMTMTRLTHVWHEMLSFDEIHDSLSGNPTVLPDLRRQIARHLIGIGSSLFAENQTPESRDFFIETLPFFSTKLISPKMQLKYEVLAAEGIVRSEDMPVVSVGRLLGKTSVLNYFLERGREPVMPKERIRMLLNREQISENETLFMALVSDALTAQLPLTSFECAAVAEISRCKDTQVADHAKGLMARHPGSFSPYLSPNEFLGHIDAMTDTQKVADELCQMVALCSLDVCKWHLNHISKVNIGYLDVVIERLFEPDAATPAYDKPAALPLLMTVGQTVPSVFDRMASVVDNCLHHSRWEMASAIVVRMMALPMSYAQNQQFKALAARIPDTQRVVVLLDAVFSQETKEQAVKSLLKLPDFSEEALSLLRRTKDWEGLPFAKELFIGVQSLYRDNDPATHVRMVSVLATLLIRRNSENHLFTSPMGAYLAEPIKETLAQMLSDKTHAQYQVGTHALRQSFPKKHYFAQQS